TFNPLKGSIAARLDSDLSKYNAYLQAAAKDWKSSKVVGSLAHGAVALEAFASQFGTVMEIFLASKNAEAAANAAQAIADQVGLGKSADEVAKAYQPDHRFPRRPSLDPADRRLRLRLHRAGPLGIAH